MSQQDIATITQDTGRLCGLLAQADVTHESIFATLRESSLLGIAPLLRDSPHALYRTAFETLRLLGRARLPLAVGLTMHQYITATIATAPLFDAAQEARRARLLDDMLRARALCAVSSFDYAVEPDGTVKSSVVAARRGDAWIVDGMKRFQSLASQADVIFFSAAVDGKSLALFHAPLKGNASAKVGALVGDGFMAATDTRSLSFESMELNDGHLLNSGAPAEAGLLHDFSRAWFQALIPAAYLGAAEAALDAARASSDGARFGRDLGKLSLLIEQGLQLSYGVEAALRLLPTELLTAVRAFSSSAQVLKYFGTRSANEVVDGVRSILGLKGVLGARRFVDLAHGVTYGALHPKANADIESDFGSALCARGGLTT